MRAMVSAPDILREVIGRGVPGGEEEGRSCHASGLLAACRTRPFHCVHTVFSKLSGVVPECDRLHDMTYPFVGGFAFSGGTCTAAAAGVLAIGLATGKIENSYLRVMAMMAKMLSGGDMMDEGINNFNAAINRGQALMEWFEQTYGTTSCAGLTGINIQASESAGNYFSNGGIKRCDAMAGAVASKTRGIIGNTRK
jgi:hypothetical protein